MAARSRVLDRMFCLGSYLESGILDLGLFTIAVIEPLRILDTKVPEQGLFLVTLREDTSLSVCCL